MICEHCDGMGIDDIETRNICRYCGGTGDQPEIRLVDCGSGFGQRRQIRVTDGYGLVFRIRRHNSNRIWDRESERFFTIAELEQEYILQRQMHQTEAATFDEYLENITSPNGACEWEYARGN